MKQNGLLPDGPRLIPPGDDYRAGPLIETRLASSPSLSRYLYVLYRRRWAVLTSALGAVIFAAFFSFKMKPVYQATARVEIEGEPPQILPLNEGFYQNTLPDESYLRTQAKVLESDSLAWRTIQQIGLAHSAEFALPPPSSVEDASDYSRYSRARQDLLVRSFRRHLIVELTRGSRMVEVSFESMDPDLAARAANALVNNYVEYYFRKKYDAARQASTWMEQQLDELKAKTEKSQQALVDYERQNAIVNISDKQNVTEQRLADLSKDLSTAESDRLQKESLYELVRSNEAPVSFAVRDDLLQRLEEKYDDLKTQYVDSLEQYGPNFPKVVRLRDQVNEVQSLIERERKGVLARIRNDYLAALGREKLAASSVAREKKEVGRLNQLLIEHNILKHEFETNQHLYESLLQRLKDATVAAGLRATNIHVVDPALPPAVPARPKKLINIAVGLLVGLLLGIAIAFVQEELDYSVKTAEEVERLIDVPSLAIIPEMDTGRSSPYSLQRRRNGNVPDRAVSLAVLKDPTSPLAESYRSLCTSILLSTAPRPPQTILVTSAQPKEGKSCTSLNLALALSQRGSRVLIIDGDLRKPGVALALGLEDEKGLSGVLTGAHSLDESLQQIEQVPGLWVLPSGPRPPNPAELVSSPTMERVLAELKGRFDYLVIDSPPLLQVTDPTILSNLVDGVILIVESGYTCGGALVRAHRMLKIAGGRVLGVVMNKVNPRQDGYYYESYYNAYRYSYADSDLAEPKTEGCTNS